MALTASKTETCTIAIVRTARGVGGLREAISAARALASVTASAAAPLTPARIIATTIAIPVRARWLRMVVSLLTAPVSLIR
jgi:hypothetical protein